MPDQPDSKLPPKFFGRYRHSEQYDRFTDACERRGYPKGEALQQAVDLWIEAPQLNPVATAQMAAEVAELKRMVADLNASIGRMLDQYAALAAGRGQA